MADAVQTVAIVLARGGALTIGTRRAGPAGFALAPGDASHSIFRALKHVGVLEFVGFVDARAMLFVAVLQVLEAPVRAAVRAGETKLALTFAVAALTVLDREFFTTDFYCLISAAFFSLVYWTGRLTGDHSHRYGKDEEVCFLQHHDSCTTHWKGTRRLTLSLTGVLPQT